MRLPVWMLCLLVACGDGAEAADDGEAIPEPAAPVIDPVDFPQLRPGGESRGASCRWREVHDLRPPSATEEAPVPRRFAIPARIPFSREDVRSLIATRIRDNKER